MKALDFVEERLGIEEGREEFASCNQMNRQGAPEEVANVTVYVKKLFEEFKTKRSQVFLVLWDV